MPRSPRILSLAVLVRLFLSCWLAPPAAADPPSPTPLPASRPASRSVEIIYTGRSGGIHSDSGNGSTILLLWRSLAAQGGSSGIERTGPVLRRGRRYLFAPEDLRPSTAVAALREPRQLKVLDPALPYLESAHLILFQYPASSELDLLAMLEEQNRRTPEDPELRRGVGRLLEWRRPGGQRLFLFETGAGGPTLRPVEDPLDWESWIGLRAGARLGERRGTYFSMIKAVGAGPRRVRLLDDLRRDQKATHCDGLLCSAGGEVDTYDSSDERRVSPVRDFEFGLLQRLGYSAIVPSYREFYWGPDELAAQVRRRQLPMVATNLEWAKGKHKGEPVFARYLLRQLGALRIAILGLLSADTFGRVHDPAAFSGLHITDPIEATNRAVHDLRLLPGSRPDVVLVLTTLEGKGLTDLLHDAIGIDIVVGDFGYGGLHVSTETLDLEGRQLEAKFRRSPLLVTRSSYTRVGRIAVEYYQGRTGPQLLRLQHSQQAIPPELPADRESQRRVMATRLRSLADVDTVLIPPLEDIVARDAALLKRIRQDPEFTRFHPREAQHWQVWFTAAMVSQMAANVLRHATGAEVAGVKSIAFLNISAPGPMLKDYVQSWLPESETVALYTLTGAQLRQLAMAAPDEVVLTGLDRSKLFVAGRPLVENERYEVALTSSVVAMEAVARLLRGSTPETRFRLRGTRLEVSRKGQAARLRRVALTVLEQLRHEDPDFGPRYRETMRSWLVPHGEAIEPRWKIAANAVTFSFSSYASYPSGSWLRYPGVRETRVVMPNNYTLGLKGTIYAQYDSARLTWDTRVLFDLNRTVVNLEAINKGTVVVKAADDLVLSTELRAKLIELGLGHGRSLALVPYTNLTFDTEFTPTVNQLTGAEFPHQKDLLASLGLVTTPGAMLQEVRLAAVLRTDFAAERGRVDGGILFGLRSEWPLWLARLRVGGTLRYFFDTGADSVEKLGLMVQGTTALVVPFTRDFSVNLGADLFLYRPKVLEATDLLGQTVRRGTAASLILSAGLTFDHAWKISP